MRKAADYEVENRIKIYYSGQWEIFRNLHEMIARETLADKISAESVDDADLTKEFVIDGEKINISIKR